MANKYCNLIGINKISDEYTKISDGFARIEADVNTANNHIDTINTNLATLTAGSTARDAELIDARVGEDGITYESVGNAIREQAGKLNETLTNLVAVVGTNGEVTSSELIIADLFTAGGYYNNYGTYVMEAAYATTDFVDVSAFDRVRVYNNSPYAFIVYIDFWDADKRFVSGYSIDKHTAATVVDVEYNLTNSVRYVTTNGLAVAVTNDKVTSIIGTYKAHDYALIDGIINEMDVSDLQYVTKLNNARLTNDYIGSDLGFVTKVYTIKYGEKIIVSGKRAGTLNVVGTSATLVTAIGGAINVLSTFVNSLVNKQYEETFISDSVTDQYLYLVSGNGYETNVKIISKEYESAQREKYTREKKGIIWNSTLFSNANQQVKYSFKTLKGGDRLYLNWVGDTNITPQINQFYFQIHYYYGADFSTRGILYTNLDKYESGTDYIDIPESYGKGYLAVLSYFTSGKIDLTISVMTEPSNRVDAFDKLFYCSNKDNIINRFVSGLYRSTIANTQAITPIENRTAIVGGIVDDGNGNVYVTLEADNTQAMESGTNAFAELITFNLLYPGKAVAYSMIAQGMTVENFDGNGNSCVVQYTGDTCCALIDSDTVRIFTYAAVTNNATQTSTSVYLYRDFYISTKTLSNIGSCYLNINNNRVLMNETNIYSLASAYSLNVYASFNGHTVRSIINTTWIKVGDYWYSYLHFTNSSCVIKSIDCITWDIAFDANIGCYAEEAQLAYDGTYMYCVNRNDNPNAPTVYVTKYELETGSIIEQLQLPLNAYVSPERPAFAIRDGYGYIMVSGDGKQDTASVNIRGISYSIGRSKKVLFKVDLSHMKVLKKLHMTPEIYCVYPMFYLIGTAMYIISNTDKRGFVTNSGSDGRQETSIGYFDTGLLDLCEDYEVE